MQVQNFTGRLGFLNTSTYSVDMLTVLLSAFCIEALDCTDKPEKTFLRCLALEFERWCPWMPLSFHEGSVSKLKGWRQWLTPNDMFICFVYRKHTNWRRQGHRTLLVALSQILGASCIISRVPLEMKIHFLIELEWKLKKNGGNRNYKWKYFFNLQHLFLFETEIVREILSTCEDLELKKKSQILGGN